MITNKGKALWANAIGDLGNGFTGTVKESTTTTLTTNGAAKWTAEQFVGQDVYSGESVGTIISNTETVLTVARWEKLPSVANPTHNRSELGANPTASAAYSIVSGATPAAWIALTTNSAAPKATNETLAEEINESHQSASGGGLLRALGKFTYLGSNEYKVEVTFTANSKDATPLTIAKIGIFNAQRGGVMMFESLLTATAAIKETGDAVTITDTITGS